MGKLKNLGSFSGKVGEVVGYEVNGKNYIRKKPIRTAPPTEGEKKQQNVFGMVQKWINPISMFLRIGYRGAIPDLHSLNAAKSIIHREAVIREPEPAILPGLVRVSVGSLALSENMQVSLGAANELVFNWDTVIPPTTSPRDQLMMLAYNPEAASAFMELNGPQRSSGTASLVLESPASGPYHIYAAFVSEDKSRQSESVYLGVKN